MIILNANFPVQWEKRAAVRRTAEKQQEEARLRKAEAFYAGLFFLVVAIFAWGSWHFE